MEVIRSLANEIPTKKQPGAPLMPCHTGALGGVSEPAESRQLGLTVPVVCHFGTAFGLWGYNLDVMLNGKGQGDHPDLIAVEESDIYAAVACAIEAQDPPRMVRREVAGVRVWVEEKPSELYAVLRHAMFEAYRRVPEFPDRP